jgi:phosphatidyl-myo-inositol alpha-mannosyltransferase
LKIALVSPYDFAHPGGVTNHISSLEHYLTGMGHDVRVIAPASKAVSAFGDKFIPIGKPRPIPASGSIARITLSLHLGSKIKEVLAREKFDIVHLHEPFMPMLCSAVLRFSNTVNIGTFHAFEGKPGYNWGWPISRWMLRRREHKLSGRIAVSRAARDFAGKYVHGDFVIIPNGVDITHFSPEHTLPMEEFQDGKLNILFVGRLEARKGLVHLLKAYHRVRKQLPPSRLIVVGPGMILRRRYQLWVIRHGISKDVIFTGLVSYKDLPRYYKTADIFCAPSSGGESFGIVLIEAMAMGKPVIASRIGGYVDIIVDGKDGMLFPPKNHKVLGEALLKLANDKALRGRIGQAGIEKSRQFAWQGLAKKVEDYYFTVLKEYSGKTVKG